ncbi:BsuPI-related putative proteinase inhibitor [Bacillus sp. 2205SS5-2]|uniref:BsuPI-related putative proteinase inhibitor n=1 Tax=Bacillus sp. 2205SS5-2 TaxID=3109031 RepID=UPI003005F00C
MKKILVCLSLSLILAACGSVDSTSENNSNNQKPQGEEEMNEKTPESSKEPAGIIAGEVVPTLTETSENGTTTFQFMLKNQTEKKVVLHFSSGQLYDYELRNEQGEILLKYSEGKMFTQALEEVTLEPGEEWTIPLSFKLKSGSYTFTFWMKAKENNYKQKVSFTVK